jgi:hypothetical protein
MRALRRYSVVSVGHSLRHTSRANGRLDHFAKASFATNTKMPTHLAAVLVRLLRRTLVCVNPWLIDILGELNDETPPHVIDAALFGRH